MLHDGIENNFFDWVARYCPLLILTDKVHILYAHRPQDTEDYTLYSHVKSVISEAVLLNQRPILLLQQTTTPNLARFASQKMWQTHSMKEMMNYFFQPHSQSFHLTLISSPTPSVLERQPQKLLVHWNL